MTKQKKLKKAIVLTYADVSKEDSKLLRETDVFKIATNFSAAEHKPDLRLCADNIVDKCLACDDIPVVSLTYDLGKDRVISGTYLPQRHTTLVSCVDYLRLKGYTHILLVATNPEGTATYKLNLKGIDNLKQCLYIYKYTKEGTFDVPAMTIKEFLSMEKLTDEEKILGYKEPQRKMLSDILFTSTCRYEVHTEGYNNKSIESGELIGNIVNYEYKQRLLSGSLEIKYNGLIIKRLTKLEPEQVEVIEVQEEEPKTKYPINKNKKKAAK